MKMSKLFMILLAIILVAVPGVLAKTVTIEKEVVIDIDFEQDNAENDRWIRMEPEDIVDKDDYIEFEWELDDPPSDQKWKFEVEFEIDEDERCEEFQTYFDDMLLHYNEMMKICEEASKGWLQAESCFDGVVSAESELASCNAQLKNADTRAQEKTTAANDAANKLSTCQNSLDNCEKDKDDAEDLVNSLNNEVRACNQDTSELETEADKAASNRYLWALAGAFIGAFLMNLYRTGKLGGGGQSIERPGDEKGGF